MPLKPLNPATCPGCRSRNTLRGGYSKEHSGSAYKCRDCGKEFIVATLVLAKPSP